MKRSIKSLIGYALKATDGEIGKVKDFYFDDKTWTIRYLIVETGNWLFGRKVLIAPESVISSNWNDEVFTVRLSQDEIKHSPSIDTDEPVSRQEEEKLRQHYSWIPYWDGLGIAGMGMGMPLETAIPAKIGENEEGSIKEETTADPHLRSAQKVLTYKTMAIDGEIGHVDDFIIDDAAWKISFLILDTGKWMFGKKVLISPEWIRSISWESSVVIIDSTVKKVNDSMEYDPKKPLNEAYEKNLYDYYGRLVAHGKQ